VQITIKAKKTAFFFLLVVFLLTLLHCVALFLFFHSDNPNVLNFTLWFDLDIERNIPSLYSAASILLCSLLFFLIACLERKTESRHVPPWLGLSAIFLFLSADEAFELHEAAGDMTAKFIHATGFLYFPWVIPYMFLTVIFILIYRKFFLNLPARTAKLFILSLAVYFTGAVVFDMLGGKEAELHGYDSLIYCLLYTVEEVLEMLGVVGIIYTLLSYLERQHGYMTITLQLQREPFDSTGRNGGCLQESLAHEPD
jgi:hypothetical protein